MKLKKLIACTLASVILISSVGICPAYGADDDKLTAFPGAEGGGMYTLGARAADNMTVYHVTNLNDSGVGSFRNAVSGSNRIIVFDVSGTIMLKSILKIDSCNLTILGQTAPGDGICIAGESTLFQYCSNVIIRYMRFRPGDVGTSQEDGLGFKQCTDVIVDHCSVSWSVDEAFSAYANRNFTAQYCIISESLNNSVHDKGAHGYGGIWGGENASFHHNLIASHNSRTPRIGTSATVKSYMGHPDTDSLVDIRNNVIYNWGEKAGYAGENNVRVNFVNNYYKKGPATKSSSFYESWGSTLYVDGNVIEGNDAVTANNWSGVKSNIGNTIKCSSISDGVTVDGVLKANDEFIYDYPVSAQTAKQAYTDVLENAGASYKRDGIDARVVQQVKDGTALNGSKGSLGLIDSQEDAGGWYYLSDGEITDSDSDGIPDEWEDKNGLDKNNDSDALLIAASGYTNIEEYANALAANPEVSELDTLTLRQDIFKGENLDKAIYSDDDMTTLEELIKTGKAALEQAQSQEQIDNAEQPFTAFLNNLEPIYSILIEDLISQINALDLNTYLPSTVNTLNSALDKANADLAAQADNTQLKADYESLKTAYDKLEVSLLPDLQTEIDKADEILATSGAYTPASMEQLKTQTEEAKALIATDDYTNAELKAMTQKMQTALDKMVAINNEVLEECLDIIENGTWDYNLLDSHSLSVLAQLKTECLSMMGQTYADNTQINAFKEKVISAISSEINVKLDKNYSYKQDFEGDVTETLEEGEIIIADDNGNKCLEPDKRMNLYTTFNISSSEYYYSTDFKIKGGDNTSCEGVLQSFLLNNIYIEIAGGYKNDGVGLIYTKMPNKDFSNICMDIQFNVNGWNNITTKFDFENQTYTVYLNNCKLFSDSITFEYGGNYTAKAKSVERFGNTIYQSGNGNRNYTIWSDNWEIYTFGSDDPFVYGDADTDGTITADDAANIVQKVLDYDMVLPVERKYVDYLAIVDVDGSGTITSQDAAMVLKKSLDNSYILPVEQQ